MSHLENAFFEEARGLCRSAVKCGHGLADALQRCEGLFPTLALSGLCETDRDVIDYWVRRTHPNFLVEQSTHSHQQDSFALSTWQFSEHCRTIVSDLLWTKGLRVCLMGVPSLVDHLPASSIGVKNLLVDVSNSIDVDTNKTTHLPYDINLLDGSEFADAFDVCVLDPPWYLVNYFKWIAVASSYCKMGGVVAFPLLGRMTRPTAGQDRDRIMAICEARGLEVKLYQGMVLYDPPSFERSILLRNGIPPVQWKRADLVVARRIGSRDPNIIQEVLPTFKPEPIKPFKQFVIEKHLIDVILDRFLGYECDLLRVPAGGYWMKTPSRREEGISDCNVFVSNGARFVSDRPLDLANLLGEIEAAPIQAKARLCKLGFPNDVFS